MNVKNVFAGYSRQMEPRLARVLSVCLAIESRVWDDVGTVRLQKSQKIYISQFHKTIHFTELISP